MHSLPRTTIAARNDAERAAALKAAGVAPGHLAMPDGAAFAASRDDRVIANHVHRVLTEAAAVLGIGAFIAMVLLAWCIFGDDAATAHLVALATS